MADPHPSPELVPPPRDLDEALRRLDALSEAAATFAHDLKNPLSAILLGVQRLARLADPARQAQARELGARLERSVQAMTRLVDGNAELTRLQAGKLRLERTTLPCADLLTRALEPLRPAAAERRQELRLALPPDLPEVRWDADRIAEAVDHVVGAALRLGPEGTVVSCSAEASGPDVVITVVVELGGGPADAPPVPEAAPPRRIRGTGLLVARSLVEAHGGRVELEDDALQTRLRMRLPARPVAASP